MLMFHCYKENFPKCRRCCLCVAKRLFELSLGYLLTTEHCVLASVAKPLMNVKNPIWCSINARERIFHSAS